MKIMQCPNCQGSIVVDTSDSKSQKVITCAHCGFSDYVYIFNLSQTRRFSRRMPTKMTVEEVIKTVNQELSEVDLSYIDVNQFIYDLHSRCNGFSPIIICKIINALLEYSEMDYEPFENETFFVRYESENISLDDIYRKLNDSLTGNAKNLEEDPQRKGPSNIDVEVLRKALQSKQQEIDTWINDYTSLSEKYKKAMDEIETLKVILRK